MLIAGLVILVVGALLLWGSAAAGKRALALLTAESQTAGGLDKLRGEMTSEIGAGALRDVCAVEGTAETDRPLAAEVSGTPCVYYSVRVEREYEETRQQGNQTTTSRGSETVSTNTQQIEFELRDATGTVRVVPADASVDARKTVERFEPEALGGFLARLVIPAVMGGRRTIGYKITEHVLGVGDRLFVLGEARDQGGRIVIAKPAKGGKLIISARTKDQLVRESTGRARWLKIAAAAAFVGGVALEVVGLVRR